MEKEFETYIKIAGKNCASQCTSPSGIDILLLYTPRTDKTVLNKYKQILCNSYYKELKLKKKKEINVTNFLLN